MAAPQYKYQPLAGPKSTRMLYIKPSISFDDDIQVDLVPVNLEKAPDHEALAQVLGYPERIRYLSCEDNVIGVNKNPFVALRRLRL